MERQSDTIYHAYFSYFSLLSADRMFTHHGLRVFDVERLPTDGGSRRINACHISMARECTQRFHDVMAEELVTDLAEAATYERFGDTAIDLTCQILELLISARRESKVVAGYAAPRVRRSRSLRRSASSRPGLTIMSCCPGTRAMRLLSK